MLFVLSLVLILNGIALKRKSNKLINGKSQTEIKNRTCYFYKDIINVEEFDLNLLKIDKSYKDINIYYISYITIKKLVIAKTFAL